MDHYKSCTIIGVCTIINGTDSRKSLASPVLSGSYKFSLVYHYFSGVVIDPYGVGTSRPNKYRLSRPSGRGYSRWFNLTILSVSANDSGKYSCKAVNDEGLGEATVHLTFDPVAPPTPPQAFIIYVVIAASALLLIIVIVIMVYCICRRKKDEKKGYPAERGLHTIGPTSGGDNGHRRCDNWKFLCTTKSLLS